MAPYLFPSLTHRHHHSRPRPPYNLPLPPQSSLSSATIRKKSKKQSRRLSRVVVEKTRKRYHIRSTTDLQSHLSQFLHTCDEPDFTPSSSPVSSSEFFTHTFDPYSPQTHPLLNPSFSTQPPPLLSTYQPPPGLQQLGSTGGVFTPLLKTSVDVCTAPSEFRRMFSPLPTPPRDAESDELMTFFHFPNNGSSSEHMFYNCGTTSASSNITDFTLFSSVSVPFSSS